MPEKAPLSSAESAALIARGDALLSRGDLVSARLFYERAADGGDGQAAVRMGETYDPAFLAQSRLNGVRADALSAARWYLRALELGTPDAGTLFKAVVSANKLAVKKPLSDGFAYRRRFQINTKTNQNRPADHQN